MFRPLLAAVTLTTLLTAASCSAGSSPSPLDGTADTASTRDSAPDENAEGLAIAGHWTATLVQIDDEAIGLPFHVDDGEEVFHLEGSATFQPDLTGTITFTGSNNWPGELGTQFTEAMSLEGKQVESGLYRFTVMTVEGTTTGTCTHLENTLDCTIEGAMRVELKR